MSTPAVKAPTKNMGLGIPPEIQRTMDAVQEVAAANNIPTQRFPSNTATSPAPQSPASPAGTASNVRNFGPASQPAVQEKKARGPKPALVRRYSVDLPVYLIDEITDKAYRKKCKKRTLILNAFKDAGFTVKDIDIDEGKSDE